MSRNISLWVKLTQLEVLELRRNQISDIASLSYLRGLRGNEIRDISLLADLT